MCSRQVSSVSASNASLSTGSLLFVLVGRALIGTELEDGAGGGKDLLR